jgi:tRNA A37 threonylcarbamoyladenosine dehydratase
MPIQVHKTSKSLNKHDQNRTSPLHITIKALNTENKEAIFKAVREKNQITNKGKLIKIIAHFSTETLKSRRAHEVRYFKH